MNLPCEIVMDLVALYQDGLANPVTKNSVAAQGQWFWVKVTTTWTLYSM